MYNHLILWIAPFCNPAKYTHQTGQPLHIFYSKVNEDTHMPNVKKRVLYSAFGIMSTTGYNMKDSKVLSFTTLITRLARTIDKQHGVPMSSLEVKAY